MFFNKKRTNVAILVCLLAVFLLTPFSLLAQGGLSGSGGECEKGKLCNPLGKVNTLGEFMRALVTTGRDIGILVAVLAIVYAGFLKVTARGDEEKLKKANQAFLFSVIGTAIILGAWLIATSIKGTVEQLENPQGVLQTSNPQNLYT